MTTLHYEYRGSQIKAAPWPDFLLEARDRIQALSGYQFNFVVGNRYRTGKDSIGWHSDDFPQIGKRPAIASLSLGSARKFKLRHKESSETVDYQLESGALFVMLPGCQEDWVHAVPKTARPVGERINWTFRPHVDAIGHIKQEPAPRLTKDRCEKLHRKLVLEAKVSLSFTEDRPCKVTYCPSLKSGNCYQN